MLKLLGTLIPLFVVPLILIALLFFSLRTVRRVGKTELKSSARAGFWAGFVLLAIFIISQLDRMQLPTGEFGVPLSFDPVSLLAGLVLGFVFLWLVRLSLPTRLVGITIMLLTATSTIALFSFIFVEGLRRTVLYLSLGLALGILFHVIIIPSSLRKLRKS